MKLDEITTGTLNEYSSTVEELDIFLENVENSLEDPQAICESEESDKVLEFKKLKEFSLIFQRLYINNEVWGVFYDDDNDLVCKTRDGEFIYDILR